MESQEKPSVAFFSFTCCEGCQLMVLSCEKELPDILKHIKIVNFREAMTEKSDDYDIAFVEGSISRRDEIRKIKKIRKQAKVVVALGACSSTGGLNCLKNRYPMEEVKEAVYGKKAAESYKLIDTIPARPIDEVVPVDYYLHGCPISKKEFLSFLTALLMGKKPDIVNHPVCVDCKMAGNICVFEKGGHCLGPVSRGGCDSICVTYGTWCWGCRGPVDNPNTDSHRETLERYGLTAEAVAKKFALYGECGSGRKC
ncbi:MAG: NADH:ubiquinone oxidoreductase [Deltaproteobacteria bacterium]|nr:NADH:ubiquinone oxidoreductase [Deltaproteobacteria bacterium]MBZ0220593.1 NADH:ubiquinone oxidoreductase [Deltaproteobacteria bacterium]